MQDLAGDERRLLQVQDRLDDVVDLGHTPERMLCGERAAGVLRMHQGAHHAERDGIDADVPRRVLDRQRLGRRDQAALLGTAVVIKLSEYQMGSIWR